jgi:glycosyltransferase involved in cell wall biosynthesis
LRDWDSPWKNNQQVMSRLARTNRVLYVGPPHTLRESVQAWRSWTPAPPIVEAKENGLLLYREPRLLTRTRYSRPYTWVTARLRLAHVRRLARGLGFSRSILWIYDPMLIDAVGTFDERFVVYYVIDNYDEYFPTTQPWPRAVMASSHRRMLKTADLVFAVSESLCAECLMHNPHCYHAPNGVPYEEFQAALAVGGVPSDVSAIPRPIVGYVGVLQSTIDLELMREVAQRRPGWSVMIVGPVDPPLRSALAVLRALPNVHYLGTKEPSEVPHYMKACDVALLPYLLNPSTAHIDSIKLYEYLACGKPVVSTDIPTARRFAQVIRIAQSPDGFVEAIEATLRDGERGQRERLSVAREHSWDQRVQAMGAVVAEYLRPGGSPRSSRATVGAVG